MAQFFLTCFLVLISVQLVKSSAVFELKVHSFTTTSSSVCKQSRDCQVFFRVCLNYTQDIISYRLGCSNGTGLTGTFSSDQSSISTSAPITVPFNLKWLSQSGTVSVIIEAWNADDQPTENLNNMTGHFATKINLTIGQKWSQGEHLGEQSKLRFSERVVCDEFYYGHDCSAFCRSRDDYFGHFTCDDAGNKTCLPGWKGDDCREPICLSGCSEEHGYCKVPGECKCKYGWRGPRCEECLPYPGCLHGTCQRPWECMCEKGWGGLLCDKDLNDYSAFCRSRDDYFGHFTCDDAGNKTCLPGWKGNDCREPICLSGCSEEHGNCKVPGECKCQNGWRGPRCEECIPYPGCLHGTCQRPWECRCEEGWGDLLCDKDLNDYSAFCRSRDDYFGHFTCDDAGNKTCLPGWKGDDCTEPICLSGCSEEHGYCKVPGECKCKYGWQGPRCEECLPYPGCLHSTCQRPWECMCEKGWGGLLCDKDLIV